MKIDLDSLEGAAHSAALATFDPDVLGSGVSVPVWHEELAALVRIARAAKAWRSGFEDDEQALLDALREAGL